MENWNEKLHSAAKSGDIEVLKICLQNAADIDHQDDVGWTALMVAAYGGHLEVTRLLLNKGCKKDITMGTGWTALMRAAFGGHLEVTRLLLGSGCKTDIRNCSGWTAFMVAAMEGYLEITRLIHDSGCTTDIKDKNGETALHMAAENGHLQVTIYLVERACISPLGKTSEDKTPYDLAAARQYDPRFKEILEYLKSVMSKYAQDVNTKTSGNTQETPMNEDEVPTEIKLMTDKRSIDVYLKLLESGSEKKRDIRLVVVGEKGAGKTSLIKKLVGEDITDVTSTNGIEIHTIKCKANSDDDLWTKIKGNNKETEINARMLKSLKERLQYKEIIKEPVEEEANLDVMDNKHVTTVGESKKSETISQQPEIVKPPGTTASKVNPPGFTQQPNQPLEQANNDFENMLKDISKIDFQDKEEYVKYLLWDFAGDEEFYHTHQTFLSSDAIYIVVAKLNEAGDKKAQEMFQLWMNSIHCYCRLEDQKKKSDSNTSKNKKGKNHYLEPPVVLIGSHKDKVQPSEGKKVEDACRENIFMYTNNLPDDERGHIRHNYLISNTDDDQTVFQRIRQDILQLARTLQTWNTDYPLKFIQLEQRLQKRKTDSPIISYDEIRNLSFDIPRPLNEEELRLFLEFHHATRALVYFKDLSEYIILDTQWLSEAFKCIVTAKAFRDESITNQQRWNELHHKGKLHHDVLEEIFQKGESILSKHQEHILNLMEKFDIIISPIKSEIDSTEDTPCYFVPCLIEDGPGCDIYERFKVTDACRSTWLCFEFRFQPPHLMNHLIASLSRRYDVAEVVDSEQNKRQIALYRGTAVFELQKIQQSRKLLIMKCPNFIQMQVWEFSEEIIRGLYKKTADLVTDDIEKIIQTRFNMSNVKFEKKWKCGLTKPDSVTKLRGFKTKSEEQISTYYCETCKQIHKFIDEWLAGPNEQKRNLHSPDISDILDQMMTRLVISVDDRRTIEQNASQEAQETNLLEIVMKRGEPNKSVCIDVLQQYSGYRDLAIELKNVNSRPPTVNTEIQDVPDYKVRLQKNYLKIINTIQHNSQ